MSHEFRVTVEDLTTGERKVMNFAAGDYVLIPFAPCWRDSVSVYPKSGTHIITIKGYRPAEPAQVIETTEDSGAAVAPAEGDEPNN